MEPENHSQNPAPDLDPYAQPPQPSLTPPDPLTAPNNTPLSAAPSQPTPTYGPPATPSVSPSLSDAAPVPPSTPGQVISGGFQPISSQPSDFPPNTALPTMNNQPPAPTPVYPASLPGSPIPANPVAGVVAGGVETPPPSKRRSLKLPLTILAVILVLAAGSAAAYVGIIVPNKPANVLKKALLNTEQQQQVTVKGESDATSDGVATKINLTAASNKAKKQFDTTAGVTVSGVSINLEARLVNQNVYLKAGDLSSLASMAGSLSPQLATPAQSISQQLSNKWIVIDSTLIKEAGATCYLNANWSLTKDDINILTKQYGQNPFTTIKSVSDDSVNGQAAKKYTLSIDDDKLAAYINHIGGVSVLKSFQSCSKQDNIISELSKSVGDHKQTPVTVWVDKKTKLISQYNLQITDTSGGSKTTDNSTFTISYGNVSVSAPANAEPALQVITSISQSLQAAGINSSDLLGSGDSSSSSSSSSSVSPMTLLQ